MEKLNQPPLRIADENSALRSILEGTATATGERFFDALVVALSKVLNTHSAWVTEYIEETRQLRALAYWADGRLTRDFLIDIDGTPCEAVIKQSDLVHYPDHIIRLYPGNSSLKAINASSYLGAPLLDKTGKIIGNLAVMDTRPMPEENHTKAIFQIFAARASAELRRFKAETELRKSEEKYRRIIETAAEGFFLMDGNFVITDVNRAFCSMVGYSREEIVGRTPVRFADEDYRQFLMFNREALFSGKLTELESTVVARSGEKIPVLIHGSQLRDDRGSVIGNMIFVTDLTQQKHSLTLAAEVQRSLLPHETLSVDGLDIAGRTISCGEIGGDYFDYIREPDCPEHQVSVVVGDVAGHGVEAALLMTTARAFLRMRSSLCGDLSQIINEMNRHLIRDVTDSGRFMTLSVIRFDSKNRSLRWVRAGHPPALVFDPEKDRFQELLEGGLPLGVNEDSNFQEYLAADIETGQVVAVGTDGIWESVDRDGNLYGMERFCAVIRKNARLGAKYILDAVYADIKAFTLGARQEDDITLVVAKVNEGWKPAPDWMI
jgi:PAS domain S-box-containing protein